MEGEVQMHITLAALIAVGRIASRGDESLRALILKVVSDER